MAGSCLAALAWSQSRLTFYLYTSFPSLEGTTLYLSPGNLKEAFWPLLSFSQVILNFAVRQQTDAGLPSPPVRKWLMFSEFPSCQGCVGGHLFANICSRSGYLRLLGLLFCAGGVLHMPPSSSCRPLSALRELTPWCFRELTPWCFAHFKGIIRHRLKEEWMSRESSGKDTPQHAQIFPQEELISSLAELRWMTLHLLFFSSFWLFLSVVANTCA